MNTTTHLILGLTGGIGRAVANSLSNRNIPMKALVRNGGKAAKYIEGIQNIEIVEGDASNPDDLKKAFEGINIVYYCLNVPYNQWEQKALRLLKSCVDAAVKHNAKLIFPGNVYVYGHAKYNPVDEKHPHAAHTKKGQIRMEMEEMLALAKKENGLEYTILRMPDFYGPFVINEFSEQLFVNALQGSTARWIGNLDIDQELIFIEDGGEAMITAALNEKANGEIFNIPGVSPIQPRKFIEEIFREVGYKPKIGTLNSDVLFKIIGLFNPVVKELVEMLYLKRERLLLNGKKYQDFFGTLPATSYSTGIEKTLAWAKDFYHL